MELLSRIIPSFESREQACQKKSEKPYHSNDVKKSRKEYHNMIDRNMDPTKYAVPSYHVPQNGEEKKGMGMWANQNIQGQDSFENQFAPLGSRSGKIRAANDVADLNCAMSKWAEFNSDGDDMTFGIIDKNSEEFRNNILVEEKKKYNITENQRNKIEEFMEKYHEDDKKMTLDLIERTELMLLNNS